MKLRYPLELIKQARDLYVFNGLTFDEIAEHEDMPTARTLRRWAENGAWNDLCPTLDVEVTIARRINYFVEKEDKTQNEIDEQDRLIKQLCSLNQSKHAPVKASKNNGGENAEKKPRKKPIKNDVSSITKEQLDELKEKLLYDHQTTWFDNIAQRIRFILKPRQIGATFAMSFEAFYDAVLNGRNKIFLSASRDQAEIFKANIIAICSEHFGIELSGSPMTINNNGKKTKFIFKSTNARTAQSDSGDLYIDEVFWIQDFKKLRSVAQAMATHKQYRITYFSTPSVTSHEAYNLWSGDWFKKTMACNDPEFSIDVSHKQLKQGKLCADGIWRQFLNVVDVVKSGFDRIDIDMLKREYAKDEFDNLFMGKFIDDAHSAFNLSEIMKCVGDSKKWTDFDTSWTRPYAMKPVVIGIDPARTIDKASVVILSLPANMSEKFRVLETMDLSGNDFAAMAEIIKGLTQKYNVVHIGIDTTGIGYGLFDLVSKFFPMVMPLHYNPLLKTQLVLKAMNVIKNKRLEFDEHATAIGSSFINIRKKVTGDKITYATNRTAEIGHADLAWAIMHALIYEPLSGGMNSLETTVDIAA